MRAFQSGNHKLSKRLPDIFNPFKFIINPLYDERLHSRLPEHREKHASARHQAFASTIHRERLHRAPGLPGTALCLAAPGHGLLQGNPLFQRGHRGRVSDCPHAARRDSQYLPGKRQPGHPLPGTRRGKRAGVHVPGPGTEPGIEGIFPGTIRFRFPVAGIPFPATARHCRFPLPFRGFPHGIRALRPGPVRLRENHPHPLRRQDAPLHTLPHAAAPRGRGLQPLQHPQQGCPYHQPAPLLRELPRRAR